MSSQTVTCPNGQEVLVGALIMLKGALKLEVLGMKRRGESAYAQTKRLLQIKGTKQEVFNTLEQTLKDNGIIK